MATKLPSVPHRSRITDSLGIPTPVWADWFQKLFIRAGEHNGQTVAELEVELETELTPQLVPTGALIPFAGTVAPTGFLFCDGSAVSRTTYATLFGKISTTWGAGDGSTTFNLPDLRGRFPVGKSASGTFQALAGTGGAESTTLPNHAHSVSLTTGTPSATADIQDSGTGTNMPTGSHTHSVSGNTGNPTSNPTIATLPPYAVVDWIIKT
jgi:microcystin-dependent protein